MKHITTLFLLCFGLTAVGQVPSYVPDFALALWYDFEMDCLDCGANAPSINDGAVEEHDGMGWYVTLASTSPTNSGQAAQFGSHPVGDNTVIDICTYDGEDCLLLGANDASVAFWVKPDQSVDRQTVFNSTTGLVVDLIFETIKVNEPSGQSVVGTADVFDGNWHHVAYVRDCESGMRLFVDGNLVGESISFECATTNSSWGRPSIGGQWSGTGSIFYPFEGGLDDFGVWRTTLSEEEITSLWLRESQNFGCTDDEACNYSPEATHDDGSCVPCSTISAFCGQGTIWDDSSQTCIPEGPLALTCPGDFNEDGFIGVDDILSVLSLYDTYCP